MTDSLKLAEMQRTSIEFERQRHLANWFIKSSPHMATTSTTVNGNASSSSSTSANNSSNKAQKLNCGTKNGTITTSNPLFYLVSGQKPPPPPPQQQMGGNLALSRSQVFTSQTNLPLQIVTTSAQEGRKPKLRRFNSHDTSANMFSVADFENARLARRNEIEMKQRLQQRLKMNSLSSGGDCSTGDSKGSKHSNDSQTDPLPADIFLERYSLPRVVRISYKTKFDHETLQSSSSNGSSSTSSSASLVNKNGDLSKQNGELFLLYRYLQQRRIFHGYSTKTGATNRKKGVMIPQEFPGYFSLLNDKGTPTATMYTALVQLVRERVYKFVSVDNLPAFTESQNSENFPARPHYIKSTARGGQVFRLLAVFEDGKETNSSKQSSNNSGREKEKGRYAQLLNENRQILYVSLSAKGKFYEVEPGVPQILQKTGISEPIKKINPDCVHRISNLITPDKDVPINIKFISGPSGTANIIPENLTINRISTENVIVACPIEDVESQSPLHLRKLYVTPEMTFIKCLLGFENEQRMLANQNVQNILKFCQFNCDLFIKMIELEILNRPERSASKSRVDGLKILKPLSLPKLLRREKSVIAHEKEDSIIFLSKNDLANLESKDESNVSQNQISDKMKVFQTTKKKWFKKSDKQPSSLSNLDIDAQAKRMSMERYSDMSKLLQERFGNTVNETISERPTSEIGCPEKPRPPIQKSLSLQDVELIEKPDLLPENFVERNSGSFNMSNKTIGESDIQQADQQHSTNQRQQSFISEKMYSEFHVKTRQYSKSSSSLHQLLQFAVPQRTTNPSTSDTKKQQQQQQQRNNFKQNVKDNKTSGNNKKLDFDLTDPIEDFSLMSVATTIIDDLPYSSVRDSLLISDNSCDDSFSNNSKCNNDKMQADQLNTTVDDARENIYAEICHDSGAVSRVQINVNNQDINFSSHQQQQQQQQLQQQSQTNNSNNNNINNNNNNDGATSIDNIYNTLN